MKKILLALLLVPSFALAMEGGRKGSTSTPSFVPTSRRIPSTPAPSTQSTVPPRTQISHRTASTSRRPPSTPTPSTRSTVPPRTQISRTASTPTPTRGAAVAGSASSSVGAAGSAASLSTPPPPPLPRSQASIIAGDDDGDDDKLGSTLPFCQRAQEREVGRTPGMADAAPHDSSASQADRAAEARRKERQALFEQAEAGGRRLINNAALPASMDSYRTARQAARKAYDDTQMGCNCAKLMLGAGLCLSVATANSGGNGSGARMLAHIGTAIAGGCGLGITGYRGYHVYRRANASRNLAALIGSPDTAPDIAYNDDVKTWAVDDSAIKQAAEAKHKMNIEALTAPREAASTPGMPAAARLTAGGYTGEHVSTLISADPEDVDYFTRPNPMEVMRQLKDDYQKAIEAGAQVHADTNAESELTRARGALVAFIRNADVKLWCFTELTALRSTDPEIDTAILDRYRSVANAAKARFLPPVGQSR